MTPEKQTNRGDLNIDYHRFHVAGQGFNALNNITTRFETFAEFYGAKHKIDPNQVTLKEYFIYTQAQVKGNNPDKS